MNESAHARRGAILRILYAHRRENPTSPRMSLEAIATATNLSQRDTIFDVWVLVGKTLLRQAELNGDVEISVEGVLALEAGRHL